MKTVILIDGGYVRAIAQNANKNYNVAFIEQFASKCGEADESVLRHLYYDAPGYRGTVTLPVSGGKTEFKANDRWLRDLAALERFAVRRGELRFRGWQPRKIPIAGGPLKDEDFRPAFEQKGVDMRVGLDIAIYADGGAVDRIVLVSGDTDMIPAMKYARTAGMEVVLIQLPKPASPLHYDLKAHCDVIRPVDLP